MKVAGIIAEYNPFHNGHYYQIEYAKEKLKADAVVVVMSGNFMQRGEPAIIDKYERADMALKAGVDLIIELPVTAACGSAEAFASSGVQLLIESGVVTDILFGCENEDPDLFTRVATLLLDETDEFKKILSDGLKEGKPFAEARANAILSIWKERDEIEMLSSFLKSPNNILGIAYTKAILESKHPIQIHPLTRQGVSHDDPESYGIYASATFIRDCLRKKNAQIDDIFSYVPVTDIVNIQNALDEKRIMKPDDISLLLHEKLCEREDFSDISDCNEEISNRIINERNLFTSFEQFANLMHTKNMNHSRIRRLLLHILLDIRESDMRLLKQCDYAPYYHVLGFTQKGSALLDEIKSSSDRPLFTSPNEVRGQLNDAQQTLLTKDIHVSDIYRILLTQKTGHTHDTEYTRRFSVHPDPEMPRL